MVVKVHDLLEIDDFSYLQWDYEKDWVISSLECTPFVVVRRAKDNKPAYLPVGIRGNERSQREAAFLHQSGIRKVITPYWLAEYKMWNKVSPERRDIPAIAVLSQVSEILIKWKWGPTGSTGFEIATGYPSLRDTSDLDLVIDAPQKINFLEAKDLLHQLDTFTIRTDIQVETGRGAFLLREWVNQRAKTVILRTETGPLLVSNPWYWK